MHDYDHFLATEQARYEDECERDAQDRQCAKCANGPRGEWCDLYQFARDGECRWFCLDEDA